MGRKRDRSHFNRPAPYSFPKRRRPTPTTEDSLPSENNSTSSTKQQPPASVVVIGVPSECSVLDIKSRFEIYGSISRTRIEPNGLAHITFRNNDSAQSAVEAAVDTSFPITLHSKPRRPTPTTDNLYPENNSTSSTKQQAASVVVIGVSSEWSVQVIWATDHAAQWKEGVMRKDEQSTSTVASKLVRAEVPLSRHGRGNRLGSAIVNPRDEENDNVGGTVRAHVSTRLVEPYKVSADDHPDVSLLPFLRLFWGCITMTKGGYNLMSDELRVMFVNILMAPCYLSFDYFGDAEP
ncbi:putative galactose oxidase-like [Capsicum annuum]|nr:putative galactose oxidase-like [Capsicum annuum]